VEILVMILVAAAGVAAVLYPLVFRDRASGRGDLDEPSASAVEDRGAPEAAPRAEEEEVAAASPPVASPPVARAPECAPREASGTGGGIEGEVTRYRQALRAGTVCGACHQANPPGSRFCSECGKLLARGGGRKARARGARRQGGAGAH
jgi:hypothetical protein